MEKEGINWTHKHTKKCHVPCFKNGKEVMITIILLVSLVLVILGLLGYGF